jgi:hypothetical protein
MSWIAATSSVTLALEEDGNGDLQPITGTPSGDLSYELDASSDIQPKEYFYDNLGGNIMTGEDNWQIPSDSLIVCVADENLAAGTPVGISNIESGLKVARAMRPSGTSITLPWTMENGTEIKQSSNIAIGGNKFAFVSSQAANDTLYVTIGEVNTSTKTITLGDPIPVTGDFANSAEYVSICRLDTDKLIVFYREDASTTIVKYRVGTVGGLGISFGAADTFFTGGTAANQIAADQISTDKGIVFVSCSTPTDCKLICFTTSGSVATAGTPLSIGTTIDDNIGGSVVKKIGTDKFMLAVGTAAASSNMCQVGTVIGGTTITLGAETVWSTADTIYQKMTILSPATDVAIVCGQNSSQIPVLNACTVSGTTPTFGTEITTGNQYDAYMYAESATSILQTNGGNEFIRRYTLSGNTLTSAGIVFDRMTSSVPYSILAMDNGYWIAFEAFSLNFNYGIQGMSNNYIGFTQNPAEKGGSVYVLTAGIDSNQTGLIPGGTYSIISGVLTFITSTTTMNTADDWFTCALSDTQIRVNR